ncbi:MAG: AMP-binding protein [Opitutales bacterium]|nr:AMP-binding protein [Opitutales bacterium]
MELTFTIDGENSGKLGLSSPNAAKLPPTGSTLIVCEKEPERFVQLFAAGLEQGCSMWLTSPDWGSSRMAELDSLSAEYHRPGSIMIPTGGTSGRLRFAVHSPETLRAAAEAFLDFFGERKGHRSLCCLPLHHVSGLMQLLRCALSGGRLVFSSGSDAREGLPKGFEPEGAFLSLVPTQLRRLVGDGAADWLSRFECVLLGGGATESALLEQSRELGIRLCPSYGMTETAALVAALKPDQFLCLGVAGGVGMALPHASIGIEETAGTTGRGHISGKVLVRAASLCRELIPGGPVDLRKGLETNDKGSFDAEGRLHLHGRMDRVINSGGVKLDPAELEDIAFASGFVKDVAALGMADVEWGQALVMFYVPCDCYNCEIEQLLREHLRERLGPVHVPKRFVALPALPRNAACKLDTKTLLTLLVD